jgi:hypothetical protein
MSRILQLLFFLSLLANAALLGSILIALMSA